MKRYQFRRETDVNTVVGLSKLGWELKAVVTTTDVQYVKATPVHMRDLTPIQVSVYYLQKPIPSTFKRWLNSLLPTLLAIALFTACKDYSVRPDGDIPGYHVYGAAAWLDKGFKLDTTFMIYQYPDPPVKLQQSLIDCWISGQCKPMSFSLYVPDTVYYRYLIKP